MGVKIKRKSVVHEDERLASQEESNETTEPPSKKPKVLTADEFIKSLRGPNASEAVKEWLFLISNKKEKSLIVKDSSSVKDQSNDGPSNSELGEEEENEGRENTQVVENEVEEDEEFSHKDHSGTDLEENESVKHIDAFLNAGGSPADLVYTLPAPENAQVSHLRHVFRALSKVLLRISAEHHEKVNEAVEVCRDLVSSFSKHINDMLKIQRSPQERRLNLELLTAMVSLDSKFAKEILNSISLEADNVDHLTSARVSHYARIAYLKFLIALLFDADNSLIMAVVNKPWLLISIMDGLQYDPSDIIVLLLMTIKRTILENKSVPKSAKLIIFNADAIISLLHLYKWKGPQNRPKSLTFWAMKKMSEKPKLMAEIDSSEADLVASAVQELLLVLLTDHRFGVIFRDTGIAHQSDRHNKMVSRVLQRIGHPWENPKVAQLVSKVLAACPDSLHSTLVSIEPFLEPRSSEKWFLCAKFIKQVLEEQSPQEVLYRQISWLTMMQLSAAAIEMCAPKSVLCGLSSNNAAALYTDDIAVAKCTIDLLVSVLRKMNRFGEAVRRWAAEGTLTYAQATSFRRHVTDTLLKHVPKLEVIKKSWLLWSDKYLQDSKIEHSDETSEKPIDILSHLLELLEMYQQLCPAALDPFHSAQSDLKLSMTTTVIKAVDSKDVAQLRNRLYQFLLVINDSGFCVENSCMQEPMHLLFNDVIRPCPTVRGLAFSVLQSLIQRAGCLEGSPQEAIVWLSVFQETFNEKGELSDSIVNMLVESMTRTCASCPKYLDVIACAEEGAAEMLHGAGASLSSLFDGGALQELFDEAAENHDTPQPSSYLAQVYAASLSPWLPAFLEVLREYSSDKRIKRRQRQASEEFTCKLILRLMYRLPHPGSLFHLLLHIYSDIVPIQLQSYIQSWLPSGIPEPIDSSLLGANTLEVKLSLFFFENDSVSLPDSTQKLFVNLALPKLDDNFEEFSDVKRLETMAQMIQISYFISFHLSQLAQLGKLSEKHCVKSQEILLLMSDTALHFDQFQIKGKERGLFFECVKVVLSHPLLFQQFNPLSRHNTESSKLLTNLISVIAKKSSCCNALQGYLVPYKDKLLMSLKAALKIMLRKKKSPRGNLVSFVDSFPLTFQEISDILVPLSNLPPTSLMVTDLSEVSQWCHLATHLLSCASGLRAKGSSNEGEIMILPSTVISQTSNQLLEMLSNSSCDFSPLVDAFLLYIKSCPQQTSHIPHILLPCFLNAKQVSVANGRFAEWLASSIPISDVLSALKSCISVRNCAHERLPVILPVIQEVLKKKEIEGFKKSILMPVYELIKEEVQLSVTSLANHPHWLALNIDAVVSLMKRFMKNDVRESLCKALEKKAPALNQEKLYYLKLVTEVVQKHPPQLLLLLIAWLGVSLKKYGNHPNQACLVQVLCQAIFDFTTKENHEEFVSIKSSKAWQETLRLSLKFGLVAGREDEEGIRSNETEISCLLLKTVTFLIKRIYSPNEDHEDIQMMHSMATQHSEFINIMMSSSPAKFELIQLLYVLLIQNPKIMENSHVPVLLAAYNASLSKTDRAILRILMLYEKSGVDLSHFRPYFWGRQGANHYSVWSRGSKPTQPLWQQPRPDQVLGLLEDYMVLESIGKYPVHSTLHVQEDENEFIDRIYDPSFCLPLFMYLLSPESPVLTHMFVKSGALALTISSLSSFDVAIRAAAYTTLSRFISHLQMARGRNKDLLLQFMSALQKGVAAYGNDNPRLPSVVSVFLARSVIEIANPSSTLYKPLINFILAKPAMNLRTVPEFLPLLHSDHVEHLSHQHWICDVVKEGLRSPVDVTLCMEVVAFKLLPSYYTCCLSDFKSKLKILSCLRAAVSVQYGASYLVRDYCLVSWLHQSIVKLSLEDANLIIEMVRLLSALWESLSLPAERKQDSETGHPSPVVQNPAKKLLYLLLALHVKLTAPVGLDCLNEYLKVLCDVTANLREDDVSLFPEETIRSIVDVMSPYCSNKRQFLDLLDLGCHYTDVQKVVNSKVSCTEEDIRIGLQVLTIQWSKRKECLSEIPTPE